LERNYRQDLRISCLSPSVYLLGPYAYDRLGAIKRKIDARLCRNFHDFFVAVTSPGSVWWLPEVFPMTRSKFLLSSVLGLVCFASGVLVAQGERHPNLMAAQDLINRAYDRITAAQQANEWDMGGHAARAKDLLDQAKHEIREATEAANHHH
jgi:hypothetical protein